MFKFSPSSKTNLTKNAKRLVKSTGITLHDARNKIAIENGFKSFPDFQKQFNIWEEQSTVYIYLSNYNSITHTKNVYEKTSIDSPDTPIKDILGITYSDAHRDRVNNEESFRKNYQVVNFPVSSIDNHKFGIKQVSNEEMDIFLKSFNHNNNYYRNIINPEEGFLFKFIHFKLDPKERIKIQEEHEASAKKYKHKVLKWEITREITVLMDKHLDKITRLTGYTENQYIEERFRISDNSFIVNNEYFNGNGLYDSDEEFF